MEGLERTLTTNVVFDEKIGKYRVLIIYKGGIIKTFETSINDRNYLSAIEEAFSLGMSHGTLFGRMKK
jgi:hypothetical protein